jgi:hypothetical protein
VARRETVVLVSDINGEEMQADEGETVRFGLDGVDYEIDLFNDQAQELRDALAPFVAAARRTGGRAKRGTAKQAGGSGYSRDAMRQMREWARAQGMTVSDRGRIPAEVVTAWEQAHQGRAA